MNIDALRHLKYVIAAIEYGSMRRVAQALRVQESTVSRNIAAIEQYLNIQLFERHNNGVRLTEDGGAWLNANRSRIDDLENALLQTARRGLDKEKISIGFCAPFGQEFLLRLVDRFQQRFPSVDVIIRDGSCQKQAAAVRRRDLDIAFVCGCCEIEGCRTEQIWEERLTVLLPASHILAGRETLHWRDLKDQRLLVPMGVEGPRFAECFLQKIVSGPNAPIVEQCYASEATVLIKVQLGIGFSISGESISKAITIKNAVWRPLIGDFDTGIVKAIWLASNPKQAVLRLVNIALDMGKEIRM